jgi:hypothetical protein
LFNRLPPLSVAELVWIRGGDHASLLNATLIHVPSRARFVCRGVRRSRAGALFLADGRANVVDARDCTMAN